MAATQQKAMPNPDSLPTFLNHCTDAHLVAIWTQDLGLCLKRDGFAEAERATRIELIERELRDALRVRILHATFLRDAPWLLLLLVTGNALAARLEEPPVLFIAREDLEQVSKETEQAVARHLLRMVDAFINQRIDELSLDEHSEVDLEDRIEIEHRILANKKGWDAARTDGGANVMEWLEFTGTEIDPTASSPVPIGRRLRFTAIKLTSLLALVATPTVPLLAAKLFGFGGMIGAQTVQPLLSDTRTRPVITAVLRILSANETTLTAHSHAE